MHTKDKAALRGAYLDRGAAQQQRLVHQVALDAQAGAALKCLGGRARRVTHDEHPAQQSRARRAERATHTIDTAVTGSSRKRAAHT